MWMQPSLMTSPHGSTPKVDIVTPYPPVEPEQSRHLYKGVIVLVCPGSSTTRAFKD